MNLEVTIVLWMNAKVFLYETIHHLQTSQLLNILKFNRFQKSSSRDTFVQYWSWSFVKILFWVHVIQTTLYIAY
jgi:hypothetical protein